MFVASVKHNQRATTKRLHVYLYNNRPSSSSERLSKLTREQTTAGCRLGRVGDQIAREHGSNGKTKPGDNWEPEPVHFI
jgi:hypothetical protein